VSCRGPLGQWGPHPFSANLLGCSDVQVCKYSPAAIRAALPVSQREAFEIAYLAALANAGNTFTLDKLHKVVATWARELDAPGPATRPSNTSDI
jgi:hypothetical protein